MPFQAVPNVAQCRVEGRQDGQLTINDLYFEISGGGITPVNIATLAAALATWATAALAPLASVDWSSSRVTAVDLGSPTGAIAVADATAVGGVGTEAAPNNVAACVSLRTAQAGRSGRGRNYVCGVPNAVVTLNTMSAGYMGDLIDAYTLLIGAGTFEAGWQLVIVSRRTAGLPRPTGIAIPVTSASFTRPTVASMRSRAVGHGA